MVLKRPAAFSRSNSSSIHATPLSVMGLLLLLVLACPGQDQKKLGR
jgi:hypothetical protein